jgi:prevent-host-death family protein
MLEINVKDARNRLSHLLDIVERGEEIVITRRGKKAARLVPPQSNMRLPTLQQFRASIKLKGEPMSRTVINLRDEERC